MQQLWDADEVHDAFAETFGAWARAHGGEVTRPDETALVAEFGPDGSRTGMKLSLYRSSGRKLLRLDTVREELELTGLTRFDLDGDTLRLESDRGSRTFVLEVDSRSWEVTKRPP